MLRTVDRVVAAMRTSDGAGVTLHRSLGGPDLPDHDPFLLLDEFRSDDPSDYIAGFPDHPHRGFETVTYMLAGSMEHRDHTGSRGVIEAGDVQWMTAGRGIVHSEMPRQQDGLMWGFQLWVNLPADRKMCAAAYQEIARGHVPVVDRDGVSARVIAGSAFGVEGAVTGIATEPLYVDISLATGARFEIELPRRHHALAYVYEGTARLGEPATSVLARQLAVLTGGDRVVGAAEGGPARLLVLAARPLGEPVVRYGPFVMNSRQEILEAIRDFQDGTFTGS